MAERVRSRAAVGWTMFAAVAMLLNGFWWILIGIVGLRNSDFFVTTPNYTFRFDASAWAWTHIILGVVVALAGVGLFTGSVLARIVGVAMAFISALVAFSWIPWYPFWAIIIVTASFFVIWALVAHGRDLKEQHR